MVWKSKVIKRSRNKEITLVNVRWKNHQIEKVTWEWEDETRALYRQVVVRLDNFERRKF